MKLFPVFGLHFEFRSEGITSEGWHGTVEKRTPENLGTASGILSLAAQNLIDTWGGNLSPIATYVLKTPLQHKG